VQAAVAMNLRRVSIGSRFTTVGPGAPGSGEG